MSASQQIAPAASLLHRLGSLRLTLLLFGLFVTCVVLYYAGGRQREWLIALPLLLLSLNLGAAILTHATFRSQLPLLAFHLALLALVLLAALGRMSSLKGELELTQGQGFSGELTRYEAGWLHRYHLDAVNFRLEGFTIDYGPERVRDATRCLISWVDRQGGRHEGVIGDHNPLVQAGYRFYTTHNKGFAALFSWQPLGKAPGPVGSIHFPPYPAREFTQTQNWIPPGSNSALWLQLQFDEAILDPSRESHFRLPEKHLLVVREGEQRYTLQPGDTLELSAGVLHYRGLSSWMGFHVSGDWTKPWLLAAGLVAVLALGWHYVRKFSAKPWQQEEPE